MGATWCKFDNDPLSGQDRTPQALRTLHQSGHTIEVAVSELGSIKVPGVHAYHTSVIIDGEEYYFDHGGICQGGKDLASHHQEPGCDGPEILAMGLSSISGKEMLKALTSHFRPGTYDLLRKNCNSFTDCALFYLLERRLNQSYRGLEQVGAAADSNVGLVQSLSGGRYVPNPLADKFDLEKVMRDLDADKYMGFHAGR